MAVSVRDTLNEPVTETESVPVPISEMVREYVTTAVMESAPVPVSVIDIGNVAVTDCDSAPVPTSVILAVMTPFVASVVSVAVTDSVMLAEV